MGTRWADFCRDDDDETEIEVEFEITPYVPQRTYGPAELCYPAEGGDVEIITARLKTNGCVIEVNLTEAEHDRITNWLLENEVEPDGPDPDDARDRMNDDRLCEYY
jgi:hypothetical protein